MSSSLPKVSEHSGPLGSLARAAAAGQDYVSELWLCATQRYASKQGTVSRITGPVLNRENHGAVHLPRLIFVLNSEVCLCTALGRRVSFLMARLPAPSL